MNKRKSEMMEFMACFEGMPDRLLKYCEILLEGKDASPYCYQDTMSFRRLAIAVTNYCNLDCLWCYRHDSYFKPVLNKELPFDKLKAIVENTKGKFRMVHIGGLGEPLLYKRILEAIGLLRKLSDNVKVTTNGTLLTRKLIDKLTNAGLTHIEVSIDAFSEDKNLELRGSKLDDLLKVVKYISDRNALSVQINSVVASMNYDSLMDAVEVFKEAKNIDAIHTIPLFTTEQMREANITVVPDKMYKALLRKLEEDIKKYKLSWKLLPSQHGVSLDPIIEMKRKLNICFTCFEDPYITVFGELIPCGRQEFADGVDATVGFEKAWNHPKLVAFRKKMLMGDYPEFCGKLCFLQDKSPK